MKTSRSTECIYWVVTIEIDGQVWFVDRKIVHSDNFSKKNLIVTSNAMSALKIDSEDNAKRLIKAISEWESFWKKAPTGVYTQKVKTTMVILETNKLL